MIAVFLLNHSFRKIEVEFKDWRGTPIELGSTVIYPTSGYGHSIHVQEAKIVDLSPDANHWVQAANYLDRGMVEQGFNPEYHDRMMRSLSFGFKAKILMTSSNDPWANDAARKPKRIQKNERLTVIV